MEATAQHIAAASRISGIGIFRRKRKFPEDGKPGRRAFFQDMMFDRSKRIGNIVGAGSLPGVLELHPLPRAPHHEFVGSAIRYR